MNDLSAADKGQPDEDGLYDTLLEVEELESLLEDLEESGVDASDASDPRIPSHLRQRMADMGLESVPQIRDEIARLHDEIDAMEPGLG